MSNNINVDRAKLAEYIKQNAQAIVADALIDIHIVKIETMAGSVQFVQTVDIEFREIPLDAVQAKP